MILAAVVFGLALGAILGVLSRNKFPQPPWMKGVNFYKLLPFALLAIAAFTHESIVSQTLASVAVAWFAAEYWLERQEKKEAAEAAKAAAKKKAKTSDPEKHRHHHHSSRSGEMTVKKKDD